MLRFLGVANYELAYRDNVILLDAGIDTLSWWEPSGVTPEMMTKDVDAILIGHAHGEHLWDAPFIGEKTGALVVADPIAMRWIRGTGRVDDKKMATVKGLGWRKVPIQRVHRRGSPRPSQHRARRLHAERSRGRCRRDVEGGLTPEQQAHDRRLGGMVPTTPEERERLIKEGTIAYFFTFDNGFTMFYTDSAGPTTDAERKIMQGKAKIDVGFIPYYGGELAIPITMEYVRLFKPDVMLPTHHDGHRNRMLDMPLGPLGLAIRNELPKTKAIAPLLRTPVCINTATREIYLGN